MNSASITIVGGGQMGSRHLQGLARHPGPLNVYVVDPNRDSLAVCRRRWLEANPEPGKEASFFPRVESMPDDYRLAILSTNSTARFEVLRTVARHCKTLEYVLFEKVLFPSCEAIDSAKEVLVENAIKSWVNCPRRVMRSHHKIKETLTGEGPFHVAVDGGEWGLASNSIHFLDYIAWLTSSRLQELEFGETDNVTYESKRAGFVELSGSMTGRYADGTTFRFVADASRPGETPKISVSGARVQVAIDEHVGTFVVEMEERPPVRFEERNPFQSEMTHMVVEDILSTGSCALATFDESALLHKIFLPRISQHLKRSLGRDIDSCPIT